MFRFLDASKREVVPVPVIIPHGLFEETDRPSLKNVFWNFSDNLLTNVLYAVAGPAVL